MSELVNQPTSRTARKVRNAAWVATFSAPVSGILAAVAVGVLANHVPGIEDQSFNIELLISAMVTGAATWLAGYQTRERAGQ